MVYQQHDDIQRKATGYIPHYAGDVLFFENSLTKQQNRQRQSSRDHGKLRRLCIQSYLHTAKKKTRVQPLALQFLEQPQKQPVCQAHQLLFNPSTGIVEWHLLFTVPMPISKTDIVGFSVYLEHIMALVQYMSVEANVTYESTAAVTAATQASPPTTTTSGNSLGAPAPSSTQQTATSSFHPIGHTIADTLSARAQHLGFAEEEHSRVSGNTSLGTSVRFGNDNSDGDRVAFKLNQRTEIFLREVSILQALTHRNCPHVTKILGTFTCHDGHVLIMPRYLPISNAQFSEMRQSRASFVDFCRQACTAVDAVHGCNVAHGDIKPDAFMWNFRTNHVVLTDFNMAQFGTATPIQSNQISGTPGWVYAGGGCPIRIARDGDAVAMGSVAGWLLGVPGCGDADATYATVWDGLEAFRKSVEKDWKWPASGFAKDLLAGYQNPNCTRKFLDTFAVHTAFSTWAQSRPIWQSRHHRAGSTMSGDDELDDVMETPNKMHRIDMNVSFGE